MRTGVDYAWGRPSAEALLAAGATFAVLYLSYDTTGKNLDRDEADRLQDAGIDVVANWEWDSRDMLGGYERGREHAAEAAKQAAACGMPPDRPIYFSADFDVTPGQQVAVNDYLDGVASVLGRDRVGIYGGYYVVKRALDAGKASWGWQAYAWSGGQWDDRAQLRQVHNGVTIGGIDTDLNEAHAEDFGQWGRSNGGFTMAQIDDLIARLDDVQKLVVMLIENDRTTDEAGHHTPISGHNGVLAAGNGVKQQLDELTTAVGALAAGGGVDSAPIVAAVERVGAEIRADLVTRQEAEIAGLRAQLAARSLE